MRQAREVDRIDRIDYVGLHATLVSGSLVFLGIRA